MTPERAPGFPENTVQLVRNARSAERWAYTLSIQIYVTDLQQLADKMRPNLPPNEWARVQGAINGLAAVVARAQETDES